MIRRPWLLLLALLPLLGACDRSPSRPTVAGGGLIPPSATVRLGRTIDFSAPGSDSTYDWSVLQGAGSGFVSRTGTYHAPFITPATSTVEIIAVRESISLAATVLVDTRSPDPSDCYGPTQDRLPARGEYVYADELPVAIVRVAPQYPDSAREAGVDGTVLIEALLCADGQIIETRVAYSVPMLDAAAESSVQKWRFSPALRDGQPVALWVAVPVKFSLHEPALAQATR